MSGRMNGTEMHTGQTKKLVPRIVRNLPRRADNNSRKFHCYRQSGLETHTGQTKKETYIQFHIIYILT